MATSFLGASSTAKTHAQISEVQYPGLPEQRYNRMRCHEVNGDMIESLDAPKSTAPPFSLRAFVFWALVFIGAVGLFRLTRDLTTCWRLTALPGTAPAEPRA